MHTVEQALAAQAVSCENAGSPLYATLLHGLLDDHRAGGITTSLLEGVSDHPIHDALPLRYLATAHRLALTHVVPGLAGHYPTCGGRWDGTDAVVASFLEATSNNVAELTAGLHRNVQTNEVGRAAALASGFSWIAARTGLPIDQLEVGCSAGILSRWDHFGYDTGESRHGDPTSTVQFGPDWWTNESHASLPDLAAGATVTRRRASDISPIDITTADGRTTMESFIWPDQLARLQRLRAAMAAARAVPLSLEQGDAGTWLGRHLADGPINGAATVVFHSIVWQYLPGETRNTLRAVLAAAGERATRQAPLFWMRMEPATAAHADLRVTCWPGGETVHLADVGYHGADVRWRARP